MTIAEVAVAALTPEAFAREFVDRRRPCLIRAAARGWPAFERWRYPEDLRNALGHSRPVRKFFDAVGDKGGLGERLEPGSPFAALARDVGALSFLPTDPAPIRRLSFERAGHADWGYAEAEEILFTRVIGTEEVSLLPPDAASFRALTATPPTPDALRPHVVTVESGDALFVPSYWWRSSVRRGSDYGAVVSHTWATPRHLFDPRLPGVRAALRRASQHGYLPLAAANAAWSLLHVGRMFKPPFTV